MYIESMPAIDLAGVDLRDCRSLTFRSGGNLSMDLTVARTRPKRCSRVYVAREDDGAIVGWALITRPTNGKIWTFQTYVRASHRRRGIGKALFNKARRGRGVVNVYAHDEPSEALYAKATRENKAKWI